MVNRRIEIDILEPDYYVFEKTNRRPGAVRRVLENQNKVGDKVPFAVVELDGPLHWEESVFHIVSMIARFRQPISDLLDGKTVVVNLNGRQDWILTCAKDDPRIALGVGSRWLGFGSARLV